MAPEENVTPPALPPQVQLYQMAIGHYLSHSLNLAATLGVADQLKDGPRPAGELAQATQTHAPSLHRVLRLLASAGVLTEPDIIASAGGEFAVSASVLSWDSPIRWRFGYAAPIVAPQGYLLPQPRAYFAVGTSF